MFFYFSDLSNKMLIPFYYVLEVWEEQTFQQKKFRKNLFTNVRHSSRYWNMVGCFVQVPYDNKLITSQEFQIQTASSQGFQLLGTSI